MRLRRLLPELAFLTALSAIAGTAGCDRAMDDSATIARSVIDGGRIDRDWVRTWKDRARFECVASSSGACQVVVFVTECPGAACGIRVLREFPLKAGEVADLLGLPPGYRYCLSHDTRPVAPACANH